MSIQSLVYTAGWFNLSSENIVVELKSSPHITFLPSSVPQIKNSLFDDYMSGFQTMGNGWFTKCQTSYNNERKLFDTLITEVYNKHGVCMNYYITTFDLNYDKIWGEDNDRKFVRRFPIMAYFTMPREEKLWSKFGIEGMDTFSMFVSKSHFKDASTFDPSTNQMSVYDSYVPKVGDIIMSEYNEYIYEISEVKEEAGLYIHSKQHLWEFVVRPFKDRNIELSGTTSGTMSSIKDYVAGHNDIFDIKDIISQKSSAVVYHPKANELPPKDPFGVW